MTYLAPCEVGSEFEEPGGKPPPRIQKSTPRDSTYQLTFNRDREALLEAEYKLTGSE